MAQTVSVIVSAEDLVRIAAIVGDRSRPLKHVQRARVVLYSADRLPVLEVARLAGVSRPAVWRWQRHYAEGGVERLLREGSRKPGKTPVPTVKIAEVLAMTCAEPPGETTHWTGRAMAKAVGLSLRTVQRIWETNKLQPHRWRSFKRSNDPAFAEKVEDIVGLYMHPPAHAVVLSIDEKSQIQALDRTQPGLPLKRGKCGTMTHDYKRNGTTTLFAAFNVLEGAVIGRCMQKHTHQEFIRFLNAVDRELYNIFRKFQREGVWEAIWAELLFDLRERGGREASPTAAVIDSQSLKSAEKGAARTRVKTTQWVTTPERRSKDASSTPWSTPKVFPCA